MGLLDYLFGERVDPEAAHNAALKGLLSTAQSGDGFVQPWTVEEFLKRRQSNAADGPIEPQNAFGLPSGQFPGTSGGRPGFWSSLAGSLANTSPIAALGMPDLSAMREQTPLAPAGSNIPTIDPAPFPLVGRAFSEAWKDIRNEAAARENVAQFLQRRQSDLASQTPNEYYDQPFPWQTRGEPWTTSVENSPLAKTITAIENNPPAPAAVAPNASQATAPAVPVQQQPAGTPASAAQAYPAPAGAPLQASGAGASFRAPDFMSSLAGFAKGLNPQGGGLLNAIAGASGARTPQDLEALNATYRGLIARGATPEIARAAVLNPQFGAQVYGKMFPEFTDIGTNIMNQPIKGWVSQLNQTATGLNGQPAGTLQGPGGTQDIVNLLQTNPGFAADVKAYAEGREVPTGRPGPYQQAVRTAAQLKYNTDESLYQARANARKTMMPGGKWEDMKVAANAAIGHLNDLNDQVSQLHNVSSMGVFNGAINKAWNTIAEQRGETPRDKALTQFQQTKQLANKELNEFYIKGGGTEAERAALEKEINAAGTEPQLHAAIANAVHLMSSKIRPMEDELNGVFKGTDETFNMVKPENQAKVDRILRSAGQPSMFGTQDQATQAVTATGPNGQKLILRNGKWAKM